MTTKIHLSTSEHLSRKKKLQKRNKKVKINESSHRISALRNDGHLFGESKPLNTTVTIAAVHAGLCPDTNEREFG